MKVSMIKQKEKLKKGLYKWSEFIFWNKKSSKLKGTLSILPNPPKRYFPISVQCPDLSLFYNVFIFGGVCPLANDHHRRTALKALWTKASHGRKNNIQKGTLN